MAASPLSSDGRAAANAIAPAPTAAAPAAAAPDLFLSYPWGEESPPKSGSGVCPRQRKSPAVASQLRAAGYSVWLDTERMPASATGASAGLDDAMAAGISASSAVVVCIAPEYAASAYCKLEAQYAKGRRKPLFFVNVGAAPIGSDPRGYDPRAFDDDNAAAVATNGWLFALVGQSMWADCRDAERSANDGGVPFLRMALAGNSKVRRTGGVSGGSGGSGGAASGGGASGGGGAGGGGGGGAIAPPRPQHSSGIKTVPWSAVSLLPSPAAPTLLGRGAFGHVVLGSYGGARVAVKEMLPEAFDAALASITTNEALLEPSCPLAPLVRKFLREAEVMHELRHPRVVSLYCAVLDVPGARALSTPGALGQRRAPVAILAELMRCDGRRYLQGLERSGQLSIAARLRLAADVSAGLAYLHSVGCVHADIKLLNVLVDDAGGGKIADFGLSCLKAAAATSSCGTFKQDTAGGTLPFMAPELFTYDAARDGYASHSKASDVYALGVTLWEIFVEDLDAVREVFHRTDP